MKSRLNNTFKSHLEGNIESVVVDQQLQSYLGILSHANQHTLTQAIKNAYCIRNSP